MVEWSGVKYDEFIRPDKLEAVRRALEKPGVVIVYGPPGTGKTTAVYLSALKLGYKVVEVDTTMVKNREERKLLLKDIRMFSLIKKVYVFDSPHYHIPPKLIKELVEKAKHPFVAIYPDRPDLPQDVANLVTLIRFPKFTRREVVEYLRKKFGPNIDVSRVSTNLNQSILALTYSSSPMKSEDIFTELDRIFSGYQPKKWDDILWIWIADHVDSFFSGRNLFNAVRILSNANLYRFPELLTAFRAFKPLKPMYVKYRYPYYFRRKRSLGGGEDD